MAVPASVLALGSVHLPALLVVSLLGFGAAAFAWGVGAGMRVRDHASAPLLALLALAAYTMVQAIPVPAAWVGAVAPAATDVWQRSLQPFGAPGPGWHSLSLDPGASVVEALKWLTYASVFFAASRVAARRGAAWGVSVVFWTGVAAAATTIGHGLLGATAVYGVYQPRFAVAPWHVGPLLNPNNLAGYLNLCTMCGLGLMVSRKPSSPRWLLGVGVATLIGVHVTSGSRGGVLSLAIGVLVLAAVVVAGQRRGRLRTNRFGWVVPVVLAGGAFAFLGGTTQTWQELYDQNLEKLLMVDWATPLIRDHPWFGIGRGAFESVFPAYRVGPGNTIYAHAENFPLQWVTEWGMPVGLAALGASAWWFRPSQCGVGTSAVRTGAWVGLLVLGVHNLFDLALEVPGVMFGALTVLGSVQAGSRPEAAELRGAAASPLLRQHWVFPAATVATGTLAVLLALIFGWHDVRSDRTAAHELFARSGDTAAERSLLRHELRRAMRRHPAEPYFPLLGALLAWRAGDENPIPWLARAVERGPDNGRAHLLLADVLARRGSRAQALMQLRFAVEREGQLAPAVAARAQKWAHSDGELDAAVPAGGKGVTLLVELAAIQPQGLGARRRGVLEQALSRDPENVAAHAAMADALLAELAAGERSAECDKKRAPACAAALGRHVEVVERRDPKTSAGARLRARLLGLQGNAGAAEQLLAGRCASATDKVECLEARVRLAAQASPPSQLPAAIKDYLGARCTRADECAGAAVFAGDIEAARGEWGAALAHYGRATREAPNEQTWLKLAAAAERVGANAQAADALEQVLRLKGADPALTSRIESLRAAVLRGTLE